VQNTAGQLHQDSAHAAGQSSDRVFGLVFAGFFALIGLLPLLKLSTPHTWPLLVSALFLSVGLLAPSLLAPLNLVWTKLGHLLHRIVHPVILALLFFAAVTPTGLIMRLVGADPLRLKLDRTAKTYWIEREPPGPSPDSIKNQY
jgi:hypothetical protein